MILHQIISKDRLRNPTHLAPSNTIQDTRLAERVFIRPVSSYLLIMAWTRNQSSETESGAGDAVAGQMSAADHLAEVATILAAGLVRLRARKSSRKVARTGESSLDFPPAGSVPASVSNAEGLS